MTLNDLLENLSVHGVYFRVKGERLAVDAPPGVVTIARLAMLRDRRDELLELARSADAVLAENLALIDRLANRRPGWHSPEILRDLVQRYHRDGDSFLFLAGDTVRRILTNLDAPPVEADS